MCTATVFVLYTACIMGLLLHGSWVQRQPLRSAAPCCTVSGMASLTAAAAGAGHIALALLSKCRLSMHLCVLVLLLSYFG